MFVLQSVPQREEERSAGQSQEM